MTFEAEHERPYHSDPSQFRTFSESYTRGGGATFGPGAQSVAKLEENGYLQKVLIHYGDTSQEQARTVANNCIDSKSHAGQHHIRVPNLREACKMPSAVDHGASSQEALLFILHVKK